MHIENYLKENFEKKLNYTIRVLGEHGDFNRFYFAVLCGFQLYVHPLLMLVVYCTQRQNLEPKC